MFQKAKMVRYKKIAESFFDRVCNVYEYREVLEDGFSRRELVLTQENIPCRRGYSTGGNTNYVKTAETTQDNEQIKQLVKLFVASDVKIKPGSKIVVMSGDDKEYYEYSGYELYYDTHCEILLKSVERWA